MKEFKVTKASDLREFTDSVYPQGAFFLTRLLSARDIKVNGVRVKSNVNLSAGDTVTYYTTPAQEAKPSHFTVYEDENLLIADKHSGVTSEGLLSELNSKGKYFAVHRLDRNTSGLIIFAKTEQAESELLSAFKEHRIHKTYRALCKNNFKKQSDRLVAYLCKGENSSVKISATEKHGYQKIITEYKVLKNFGDISLIEVNLLTGKTHQIRAHTAFIGCPVLGDGKYGDSALNKKYNLARQCLVAKFLSFELNGALAYMNTKTFESSFDAII